MQEHFQKIHDFYDHKPGARIYQQEFGFYCLDRWKDEGYINDGTDLNALFGYDPQAVLKLGQLGGCEASLFPCFEEKVLEDRGKYELVQDFAGRHILCFKGRRNGFMPEYVGHPVATVADYEEKIAWRMDPSSPERYTDLSERMTDAAAFSAQGGIISQNIVGGYMYLRSLIGPETLLYTFYDDPALIHRCMEGWFRLADAVSARHQQFVDFDEVFFDEDICYNHGPLISPDMIREFLFPYYRQLLQNIRSRQKDKNRTLHFNLDSDGYCIPIITLYRDELGMDTLNPCEVAAGSDVIAIRNRFPDLLLSGGIDKRVLAQGKEAIDRELERIMPFMVKGGGYLPTCDHGVPEEVTFENYMYYRKRMLEY